MNESPPSPPSLPSLSPTLLSQFQSLPGGGRVLFKTVFHALWRWLWPLSRVDAVALAYAIPSLLDKMNPRLSALQFFMLCRLITLSGGGSSAVNTLDRPFNDAEGKHLIRLSQLGFIVRTSFDPAHPHRVRPSHITKTYISLTPSGISFYKLVVYRTRKAVNDDLYTLAMGRKRSSPDS